MSLFLARHGFDIALLLRHFTGTPGATFFTADVVINALFAKYLAATSATMGR